MHPLYHWNIFLKTRYWLIIWIVALKIFYWFFEYKWFLQIVLFLAGLQSIPQSFFEASRVEGATKWEEFWFITFPMLSRVTLLVTVFTMVELITSERTTLIKNVYSMMRTGNYDETSAMMWFYFLICGGIMALTVFLYNRFLVKRWE